MSALLEVKNLKKYFKTARGTLHAVDDVSFTPGYPEIRHNQAYPEEKNIPKFQRESLKCKWLCY